MLCSKFVTTKKREKRNIENLYINMLEFFFLKRSFNYSFNYNYYFSIFYLTKNVPKELSPREDRGAFFMIMESPEGSTFENTVEQMLKLEKLMQFNDRNEANRILLRVPEVFLVQKILAMELVLYCLIIGMIEEEYLENN